MNTFRTIILSIFITCIANIGYSQSALLADTPPSNVGGKGEFKRIFEQELMYPEKLLADKTIRKVTINFKINRDSSITDLKIISSGEQSLLMLKLGVFSSFINGYQA